MFEPVIISRPNISLAWAAAFLEVYRGAIPISTPLIISAGDFDGDSLLEAPEIRQAVDVALQLTNKWSCKINADLIFPQSLWERTKNSGRLEFFRRYITEYYPRLKARDRRRNGKGTYFLRMIEWPAAQGSQSPNSINQLEHVISMYSDRVGHGSRPRLSALQISCFDPARDHSRAALSIFPCLQQLSIVYGAGNALVLNAYYPSQYIFDRAYGNYVGLSNLGRFIAGELGLTFRRLNCFISSPKLGSVDKGKLRPLADQLADLASQTGQGGASIQ